MGDVKLNSAGIASVLKSGEMQSLIADVTASVADNVRSQGIDVEGLPGDVALPVETSVTVTDRARGSVRINHPAGAAVQAKHGALTRAASAAGLQVREG